MNAAVTISRRELLSGRDPEPDPLHPLAEEDLVLVPAAEDSLMLHDLVILVLYQEPLAGRREN